MGSSSSKQLSSSKNNDNVNLNPTSESNKKDSNPVLSNESVDESADVGVVDRAGSEHVSTNIVDQGKPPVTPTKTTAPMLHESPEEHSQTIPLGADTQENIALSDKLLETVHVNNSVIQLACNEMQHEIAQPFETIQVEYLENFAPMQQVETISSFKIETKNDLFENIEICMGGKVVKFYFDNESFEYTTPNDYNNANLNNYPVFCQFDDFGKLIAAKFNPNDPLKLKQRDVMIPLKWKRNNQLICYVALTLKLSNNGKTNVTLTMWTPTDQFILNFVNLPGTTTTASSNTDKEFWI